MIAILGQRADIKLAVVTGSTRQEALLTLETLKIDRYFGAVITADDVTNGKPDPEGYLLAASRLSVDPALCLVIEDSPSGVMAGKHAGMTVLALTTTHLESDLQNADRITSALPTDILAEYDFSTT